MNRTKQCPECGQPMVTGRTFTEMTVRPAWLPEVRDIPVFFPVSKQYRGKDSLDKPVFLTRYSIKRQIYPAWYCTQCDLFLMDCKTVLDEDFYDNPKPNPKPDH